MPRSNIVTLRSLSQPSRLPEWSGFPKMLSAPPLFTAVVGGLCIGVFFSELLHYAPSNLAVCLSPAAVLTRGQVYRIVVAPFFHTGILHILFNMVTFYFVGAQVENEIGTLAMTYTMLVIIIPLAGVIHTLLSYCIDALSGLHFRNDCAVGLSGALFSLIVLAVEMSGASSISFFGFFTLPARVYPWFLLVVLSLISPGLSFLGHLSGVLVGYAIFERVLSAILPSDSRLVSIESSLGLASLPLYRANPVGMAGFSSYMPSRDTLPTSTQDAQGGSSPSNVLRSMADVVKAWVSGLSSRTSNTQTNPFPGEGQRVGRRTGVPSTSRLLAKDTSDAAGERAQTDSASDQVESQAEKETPAEESPRGKPEEAPQSA